MVCVRCPQNLLEIGRNDALAQDLLQFQRSAGIVVILAAIGVVVTHWRSASRPQREAAAPVLLAGSAAFATLIMSIVADVFSLPYGDFYGRLAYYGLVRDPH